MKTLLAILTFALALLYGCKKDDGGTNIQPPTGNYFPFEVGRSWTYNTTGTLPGGQIDPRATHTVVARVFQMNQSVAGQPNATIIQATYENNYTDNLVFYAEPTKLVAYIPTSALFETFVQWVQFYPGYQYSTIVGVNRVQSLRLYDINNPGASFEIRQQPNINLARATMIQPDTLKIEGVAVGVTSMVLGKVGSSETMTIAVNVFNSAQAFGPVSSPWMPIWEASLSTSERDMYTWDTTFSFIRASGATLRDRIVYRVTGRFVQYETVSAAGGSITAEKHVVQISIAETIDSISGGNTYQIFNGLSSQMTGNLWMASGIGFVKGEISGSDCGGGSKGLTFLTGYLDPQGRLRGVFLSPRILYFTGDMGGGNLFESLSIETRGATLTGSNSFVLSAKNF